VQVPDPAAAMDVIERCKGQLRLALFLTGAPDLAGFAGVAGQVAPRRQR